MNKSILGVLLGVGLVAAGGCSTVAVKVPVTRPAEVNLQGVTTLAIMPFEGTGGIEVADEITQAVFDGQRYQLVDRQRLEQILQEQGLQASAISDAGSAVKIGKVLGAAALVFGRVGKHEYGEQVTKRTVQRGSKKEGVQNVTVYTRTGTAKVAGSVSVISCESGRVLATKRFEKTASHAGESDEGVPASFDGDPLLATCRTAVVADFMKAIAPWQDTVEVPFKKNGKVPELAAGIAYAQRGDWANATQQFDAGLKKAEASKDLQPKQLGMALVDLGFAYLYTERFDESAATFKRAYEVTQDAAYLDRVKEVQKRKKEIEELAKQAKVEG